MIHILVRYFVYSRPLEFVKQIIDDFVSQVKQEQNTLLYQAFQEKEDPLLFQHIMTFKDEGVDTHHRNTAYVIRFVEKLYPLCIKEPESIHLNLIRTPGYV